MSDHTPRIAVLGAGGWGWNHVRTFAELGSLALVCDPDPLKLDAVRHSYPGVATTSDPIRACAAPDIDGVVLATPAPTHADLALAALEAGKDVLVEKPLAMDLAAGQAVVDTATRRQAVLMVGHVFEYHAAVRRLRLLVQEGALGPLRWLYSTRLNFGRVRVVENALWSFAPHDIALLTGLVGEEPETISCRGGAYLSGGVEDVAFLGLSFRGGVEGQVSVSWLYPIKERKVVVVGETAMVVFDDLAPPDRRLVLYPYRVNRALDRVPEEVAGEPEVIPVAGRPALTEECAHFIARIRDRGRPLTDGPSAMRTLRILDAASRSLASGSAPVSLCDGASVA
jgi:UDP-2-acetamido-3-amino-2,3-dideoxy-glucuronate N-acetyltransferase